MIRKFREKIENVTRVTSGIRPKKKVYFEAVHKRMETFAPEAIAMFVLETAGKPGNGSPKPGKARTQALY